MSEFSQTLRFDGGIGNPFTGLSTTARLAAPQPSVVSLLKEMRYVLRLQNMRFPAEPSNANTRLGRTATIHEGVHRAHRSLSRGVANATRDPKRISFRRMIKTLSGGDPV